MSSYFSPSCFLEWEGDSVRDGRLSSETVSAFCSARMTPASPSAAHERSEDRGCSFKRQKRRQKNSFINSVLYFCWSSLAIRGSRSEQKTENGKLISRMCILHTQVSFWILFFFSMTELSHIPFCDFNLVSRFQPQH